LAFVLPKRAIAASISLSLSLSHTHTPTRTCTRTRTHTFSLFFLHPNLFFQLHLHFCHHFLHHYPTTSASSVTIDISSNGFVASLVVPLNFEIAGCLMKAFCKPCLQTQTKLLGTCFFLINIAHGII